MNREFRDAHKFGQHVNDKSNYGRGELVTVKPMQVIEWIIKLAAKSCRRKR